MTTDERSRTAERSEDMGRRMVEGQRKGKAIVRAAASGAVPSEYTPDAVDLHVELEVYGVEVHGGVTVAWDEPNNCYSSCVPSADSWVDGQFLRDIHRAAEVAAEVSGRDQDDLVREILDEAERAADRAARREIR